MCGICGQFNFDSSRRVDTATVRRMMDSIRHRGPDDEGIRVDGRIGLGFRRLSIIDLLTGHQPMSNEDESLWIVFNGEIYNHLDLRRDLEGKGHRYRTRSDTETILHLYEEEGIGGFSRLNGMFAFAIWDGRSQTLTLARDRVGKKPLYYAVEDGTLRFGSEIKALFAGGLKDRSVYPEALSDFLTFLFVPGPKTMFRAVKKLQPGHVLVVSPQGMKELQFWDLHLPEPGEFLRYEKPDRYVEEFSELLEDAIRLRLISDVPLGTFLSGGLDSGSIVALMSKHSSGPVATFSVGYSPVIPDNDRYDERKPARQTARHFQTDHHEIEVKPEDLELLPHIIWHVEEPMADISVLPQFKLSALAREHVTVSLSGDGSDEMLLGYGKHQAELLRDAYLGIPSLIRRGIVEPLLFRVPDFHWRVERFKNALRHASEPFGERALGLFAVFEPEAKEEVLDAHFYEPLRNYRTLQVFEELIKRQTVQEGVNLVSYLDFKTRLVDQLLLKLDKVSMAVSLECRAPFLDYRLLEYLVRVPPKIRLHHLQRKYLLKKAGREWLPREIVRRKKKGFGFPIASWLRHGVTPFYHEILLDERTRRRGYFTRSAVEQMLQQGKQGDARIAGTLTVLLFFELWCRVFLDGEGGS